MIPKQSLLMHTGLLVVAGALGFGALTKEDDDGRERHEVELWSASPEAVKRIEYEAKDKKIILDGQKDEVGRYFVGTVDREKPEPPKNPHQMEADAGAPRPETEVKERETLRFVGVQDALDLAESLSALRARRALGKLAPDRYEEFGFVPKEESTLRVAIDGNAHELVIGGQTPGGSDVYVRNPKTGEAFVIPGNVSRDLASAESRLIARDFFSFDRAEIAKAVIHGEGSQRDLLPVAEQKGFWANPTDPTVKDETASNWMTKLDRLRVTDYIEKPEPAPEAVARVEFLDEKGKALGRLELATQPPLEGEDRPRYLARSTETRWYGTVLSSVAEQLVQDLPSVLNP